MLRRFRPPLRPRRRLVRPMGAVDGAASVLATASEAIAVNAAAFCSNSRLGSGAVTRGAEEGFVASSAPAVSRGGSAPRRAAASWAFVFHSERRKRSAAVEYHFAASRLWPAASKWRANSKATIASPVFSNRFESCPAGSLPVRARRIRAVICFQSAIRWPDCSSGGLWAPAARGIHRTL